MKYIVTQTDDGKREIFLFPRDVPHAIMAEAVARLKDTAHGDWRRITRRAISAGFVEGGRCCGRGESLGLESHESDNALLAF